MFPVKLAVDTGTPFFRRVTEVIPEAVAPVSVKVRLVKFTELFPGFIITICSTVTPEAPGTCTELPGGLVPCEFSTVTGVGEEVSVGVPVFTRVFVGVSVAVKVGLAVAVKVAVLVAVFVKVLVAVMVGVLVVVLVKLLVGVSVAVQVEVAEVVAVAVKVGLNVTV